MNNNKKDVDIKVNTDRIPRDITIGNNIYNNSSYRYLEAYINNIANERHKLAENPMRTGVIPNFYNQLKEVDRRRKYYLEKYLEKTKNHEAYLKSLKEKKVEGFEGDISDVSERNNSIRQYMILLGVIIILFLVIYIMI